MNQQYKYSQRHDPGRGSQTHRVLSQTSVDWLQKKGGTEGGESGKGAGKG